MKRKYLKLFALVLVVILSSLPITASAATAVSDFVAFTIKADTNYTNSVRTTDVNMVSQLSKLIADSEKAQNSGANAKEIARLTAEKADLTKEEYIILRDDTAMYFKTGNRIRMIPDEDFYAIAESIYGFYSFRTVPTAKVLTGNSATAIAPQTSGYNYLRLDGRYYRPNIIKDEGLIPKITATQKTLPLPEINPLYSLATVKATKDGSVVFSGDITNARSFAIAGGSYRVSVTATYLTEYYKGDVEYVYDVASDVLDGVSFSAKGSTTYPGEIIVLRAAGVSNAKDITFKSDIDFTPIFYPDGKSGMIALMPISYFTAVGEHYVTLASGGVENKFGITAQKKDFQIQNLTVGSETAQQTILSQQANDEFNKVYLPLRFINDSKQYWEGRFILPIKDDRITTQFGTIRYTNGSTSSSRHGGVDMAAPTGTVISAPNAGRVLYAGKLKLTGYSIMIEHGYGLKTWYYHMDSVTVKTGEMVSKGQQIGTVGTTGFSTGPHLHYAMSINNVFVNPYTVTNTDLLLG